MKFECIAFVVFLFLSVGCSQKVIQVQSSKNSTFGDKVRVDSSLNFPKSWIGKWCGELMIYDSIGLSNTLPMALEISKADYSDNYNWTIIYGEDSLAQSRAYELIEKRNTTGHYIIDEKNGIFLDAFFRNDELTSIFEVMGNNLMVGYKMESDHILFTVKLFPSREIRTSGGLSHNDQDIPKVKSFKLASHQVAELYKKCLVE